MLGGSQCSTPDPSLSVSYFRGPSFKKPLVAFCDRPSSYLTMSTAHWDIINNKFHHQFRQTTASTDISVLGNNHVIYYDLFKIKWKPLGQ